MKSKDEFKTLDDYKKYLVAYYAGLAMQGQVTAWNGELTKATREMMLKDIVEQCGENKTVYEGFMMTAVKTAEELVKALNL